MRASRLLSVVWTLLPALALAQTPQLMGVAHDIHVGPGDQSDPHLSAGLVAYTSALSGTSEIRFHRLEDGTDAAIPTGGAFDILSDISGTRIVFTRIGGAGSAVMSFDVETSGPAVEVAPVPEPNRRGAVIGGPTIAWLDFGLGSTSGRAVLAAVTGAEQVAVPITDGSGLDRDPALSPDGQVLVWTRCASDGRACAIHQAQRVNGAWEVSVLASLGESSRPDTNGELVVYGAERTVNGVTTRDIYWQPVGGGAERRLALEGDDENPNVGGRFVAFERRAPDGGGAADIVLYDLDAGWLYQLTDTPVGESLNDVSVGPDGTVQVVWTVPGAEGLDVKGMTLRLQDLGTCTPVQSGCDDASNRPLLAEVSLDRTCGPKALRGADFTSEAAGTGLLCVLRSGRHDVTAAWVWVDGDEVLGPRDFKQGLTAWEREVPLAEGPGTLEAALAGAPGGSLVVRLHGAPACPRNATLGHFALAAGHGALQPVPGRPLLPVEALASLSIVQPGAPRGMGCSASAGGPFGWALLLLVAAWLLGTARPRTLIRLRVHGRRR